MAHSAGFLSLATNTGMCIFHSDSVRFCALPITMLHQQSPRAARPVFPFNRRPRPYIMHSWCARNACTEFTGQAADQRPNSDWLAFAKDAYISSNTMLHSSRRTVAGKNGISLRKLIRNARFFCPIRFNFSAGFLVGLHGPARQQHGGNGSQRTCVVGQCPAQNERRERRQPAERKARQIATERGERNALNMMSRPNALGVRAY